MTIAAHTNLDSPYPGYISINKTDKGVSISVRGDPRKDQAGKIEEGSFAVLSLSPDAWNTLKATIGSLPAENGSL